MSPNFPRYNSQGKAGQISTQPQEIMREGSADQLDIVSKGLEQVADITKKWSAAMDSMQETSVKSNIAVGMAQIKQEALNDPEINNEKLQIDKIKKLHQSAMGKGLQNKSLEQKLNIELDTQEQIAVLEINNIYAKKKLFQDNLNTDALLDSYAQMNTPESRQSAFDIIKDKVSTGIYSDEQGKSKWNDFLKRGVRYDIYNDNSTTEKTSQVLKDLKNTNRYSYLDSAQRLDMIQESQRRIFQNNQTFKKEVDNNEDAVTARLADKNQSQPTEDEVITAMNAEQITPKFAKAVIENIKSTAEKKEDRGADFSKMVDFITNPANNPEDIRIELIRKQAMGNLDNEEFNILYTFNKEATIKAVDKMSPHKSGLRSIYDWSNANAGIKSIESRARMFKYYMTEVNKGINPEVAVKDAIKWEVVNLHPQIGTYPETGQLIFDIMGNLKIAKPGKPLEDPKPKGQ